MNASNAVRVTAAIVLLGFAGVASAQAQGGEENRGSLPPGTTTDGSRPGDGAINGGSILPGESNGLPGAGRSGDSSERLRRCQDPGGTLRHDCLLNEHSSNTRPPKAPAPHRAHHPPPLTLPP